MRDDETTRMPGPAGDEDGRATAELDLGATRAFPRGEHVGGAGAGEDAEATRALPAASGGSHVGWDGPSEAPTTRMPSAASSARASAPSVPSPSGAAAYAPFGPGLGAGPGAGAGQAPPQAPANGAQGYAPIQNPARHVPAFAPHPAPRSPAPGGGARFGIGLVGLVLALVIVAELVGGTAFASTALRRAMATFSAGDAWAAAGLSVVTWIVVGLTVLALAATARVSRAGAGVAAVVLLLVGLVGSLWMPLFVFSAVRIDLPPALDDWTASEGVSILPPVLMVLAFALFGLCAAVGGARRRAWERGAGIR